MRRIISVALCLVMLFSVPVSASAAQEGVSTTAGTAVLPSIFTKVARVKGVKTFKVNPKSLKIKWKKVDNATSYQVFCSRRKIGGYVSVKTVTNLARYQNSSKVKVKIKGLQPNTTYYFKIRAYNGTKKGKCSKPVAVLTKINVLQKNYIHISQIDPLNKTIPYPYEDNGKTIGSSGCGVCSALMVIKNTTNYAVELKDFTNQCLATDCRQQYGSDMLKIAELMSMYYSMNYTVTKSNKKLKSHLAKGYMATAHVGKNLYFSDYGGHFVAVAGMIKGATPQEDRVIILDPSFSLRKYDSQKRVELGIGFTPENYVVTTFDTLRADCKTEYYILYTPAASVAKTASNPNTFIPKPYVPGEREVEEELKRKEAEKLKQKQKQKQKEAATKAK